MKKSSVCRLALIIVASFSAYQISAQSLTMYVSKGVNVVIEDSLRLMFNSGSLVNDGVFAPGMGNVVFRGNQPFTFIGGRSITSFYRLTIDHPGVESKLIGNINVMNSIELIGGILELNSFKLDLGASGFIKGEREGALITGNEGGTVQVTRQLDKPINVNPGNIGIELTSAASFGRTVIVRGHQPQRLMNGVTTIFRYFELQPAYNGNETINAKFRYDESELGSVNENSLRFFMRDAVGSDWRSVGNDRQNLIEHWVTKNNVKAGSRFTLGNSTLVDKEKSKAMAQVAPNPTTSRLILTIHSNADKEIELRLLDAYGHLLERNRVHLRKGTTTIPWRLDRYPQGQYIFSFSDPDYADIKVIKQ